MDQFKETIKSFSEVNTQMEVVKKTQKDLKSKRDEYIESIMSFMVDQSIDQVNLPGGKKIVLGKRKSKEAIKKEYIEEKLQELIKNNKNVDASFAQKASDKIMDEREVTEKPFISIK